MKWTPRRLRFGLNVYPPYLLSGIHIDRISDDWMELDVSMRLRWYNRNAVGTHFGGSLYSMIDPHLMLMLMGALGKDYVVWDQSAEIHFRRPGKGRVRSSVRLTGEILDQIRERTGNGEVYRPSFDLKVIDEEGTTVADVHKVIYIRRKDNARDPGGRRQQQRPEPGIESGNTT